jgi:hypothetical protein
MGMFEYVMLRGKRWVCPGGHSLEGMEFQTKSFANDCSTVGIVDDLVTMGEGYRVAEYAADDIEIYGDCEACGAYFQYPGNDVGRWLTFKLKMNQSGILESVELSECNDWSVEGRRLGGIGPMPTKDAKELKYAWWDVWRGDHRAEASRKRLEAAGVPVELWLELRRRSRAELSWADVVERLEGKRPEPVPSPELKAVNEALKELYSDQKIEQLVYANNPFLKMVMK